MKITPEPGYVLVSNQDLVKDKKVGVLIVPSDNDKKTYLRTESEGKFPIGTLCFAQPFKTKMEIEDNLFLIDEDDIVATFILGEE